MQRALTSGTGQPAGDLQQPATKCARRGRSGRATNVKGAVSQPQNNGACDL
jgi:hypothetical protein